MLFDIIKGFSVQRARLIVQVDNQVVEDHSTLYEPHQEFGFVNRPLNIPLHGSSQMTFFQVINLTEDSDFINQLLRLFQFVVDLKQLGENSGEVLRLNKLSGTIFDH